MRVILVVHARPKARDPDALYVSLKSNLVWRGPHQVQLWRAARSILAVLVANAGRNFSTAELIEAAYGDHPRGGPESAENGICQAVTALRCASGVTGVAISGGRGAGYRATFFMKDAA